MSTSAEHRVLTIAGALLLLVLQVGGALLLLRETPTTSMLGPRVPVEVPDILGAVEFYGDDVFTVTSGDGLEQVRIDPSTVLTTLTGPARPADIRPGSGLVIWGRDPARVILVSTVP
ncbi:MAG TPA: hypothetical protein VGR62_01505 [Candidatus Binatia bacterium]|jgi:hypothetical protein|nr:hypothetical protein [Candidatus Binatia bacterium]